MVGGLSLVGSLVVDPLASPCLCLDSWASPQMNHTGSGEPGSNRKPSSRKHLVGMGSVALGTCFVGSSRVAAKAASSMNKRRGRGFVVVNELGGQYEDSFHDVKAQIFNLFTYKAVRTVMNQLYEMNPTQYRWFYEFVVTNKPTDGKRFLRVLQKEKHELAERVMVTRLHLYGKWVKKLDHAEMYKDLSDQNLELMRERLLETVKWPFDDTK